MSPRDPLQRIADILEATLWQTVTRDLPPLVPRLWDILDKERNDAGSSSARPK
jgi:hypothetical protein